MNVAVDAAGRGDQVFAGDHLGPRTDDELRIDLILNERIARLADAHDSPGADADVAFDNAPMVEDNGVGDDEIERRFPPHPCPSPTKGRGKRRFSLAVANHLAAAELHFLTVNCVILLDLYN